jgi:hypothetical protein
VSQVQAASVHLQQRVRRRPFGVTLIALYEFLLIGLIIYGVWAAFAAHFARSSGTAGRDPLDEYFSEIFIFVPLSLICHLVAGAGLWFQSPTGRIMRMGISYFNVICYLWGKVFFVFESLPNQHPSLLTAFWVLSLDILIFCYLEFYPGIKEQFGRRAFE